MPFSKVSSKKPNLKQDARIGLSEQTGEKKTDTVRRRSKEETTGAGGQDARIGLSEQSGESNTLKRT